jgi:hypothetical protein
VVVIDQDLMIIRNEHEVTLPVVGALIAEAAVRVVKGNAEEETSLPPVIVTIAPQVAATEEKEMKEEEEV